MERGYVKIWRKSEDSPVFKDAVLFQIWVWLLWKACHKKQCFPINAGGGVVVVTLERGQLIYGRNAVGKALNVAPSTVRNKIKLLDKLGKISQKPDKHHTIITICNYDDYQDNGKPTGQAEDKLRTSLGQAEDTYKNVKNDKKGKIKKKSAVSAKPCSPTDISLTDIFVQYLTTSVSKAKIPGDLTKWRDTMRLMREVDNHIPDEITAVIQSLTKANSWWTETGNLRSVAKLREKFPALYTTMTSKPRQNKKQQDNLAFIESLKVNEPLRVEAITTKRIGE